MNSLNETSDWEAFATSRFELTKDCVAKSIVYGKWSTKLFAFVFAALTFLFSTYMMATGAYVFGAFGIAIAALYLVFILTLPSRLAQKTIRSMNDELSMEIRFSPAGIVISNKGTESKILWDAVTKTDSSPSGLFIIVTGYNVIFIPAAALPDSNTVDRIIKLASPS